MSNTGRTSRYPNTGAAADRESDAPARPGAFQHEIVNQIAEALGADNRWFAGETLGREPTDEEAIRHWIAHGGASDWRWRSGSTPAPRPGDGGSAVAPPDRTGIAEPPAGDR